MNKPPRFKDLHIRIPVIIPIKGKGVINDEGLGFRVLGGLGYEVGPICTVDLFGHTQARANHGLTLNWVL